MASSYSTDLKLELMVTGENAGTWGDNTNNNLNLIQQAIAGYEAVALSDGGTVALAMTDKTISNARNMVIKFTGTLTTASTVTIPDSIEKFYIFDLSAVTGVTNLTIKTVSGTGFTAGEAKIVAAYSDGTNLNEIALDTLGGTIGTAQIADNSITSAKISDNQITTAKISDNQITTAKISDNQITTAKVSDLQITTAKIANDAVGPDQLSDTTVTPGSYTAASITVDQQGRLTAAADGSGGAGGFVPNVVEAGSNSGTLTSNGTQLLAYAVSGGGGGSGGATAGPVSGGPGGVGRFGAFSSPISAPFSQPYSVGAAGNGGGGGVNGRPGGGAGGATSISTIFSINGGTGAPNTPWTGPAGSGSAGNIGSGTSFYTSTDSNQRIFLGSYWGNSGNGGTGQPTNPGNPGNPGRAGFLAAFDNTGS
jgi:hypothetical protein